MLEGIQFGPALSSTAFVNANWQRVIPLLEADCCGGRFIDAVVEGRFCFNGETYPLGLQFDWLENPSNDIEWHILLHKFYYAPGLAARYLETGDSRYLQHLDELIASWILQVEPGFIACDVTARRVQNWLYALSLLARDGAHTKLTHSAPILIESFVTQVEYIIENMAPQRNHRTMEIYTVLLAAIALQGSGVGEGWMRLSIEAMLDNIKSDLLDDGVHCELSTDYHHIVLRSYLLFYKHAKVQEISLPEWVDHHLCAALDFCMHIHRPDGYIPALSDGDSRDFTKLLGWGAELFARQDYLYVATRGEEGKAPSTNYGNFLRSGYYVRRSEWSEKPFADARYLVFDAGPVGAGNHGHMDALSIELYAYGKPLVIDPGRYTYHEAGDINWRKNFRGNQSHNTVSVDEIDQARYKTNRTGKSCKIGEPYPVVELVEKSRTSRYHYLHGLVRSPNYAACHRREIWFVGERYWVVLDRLTSPNLHEYTSRFQLTPDIEGEHTFKQQGQFCVYDSGNLMMMAFADLNEVHVERGWVSKTYGVKHVAPRLAISKSGRDVVFLSIFQPYKNNQPTFEQEITGEKTVIRTGANGIVDTWEWSNPPDFGEQFRPLILKEINSV